MLTDISERAFEDAIESCLLRPRTKNLADSTIVESVNGIACNAMLPLDGYQSRRTQDYNRTLCLIPQDTLDFILATQPQTWTRLAEHYGKEVQAQFLNRLASEIGRRGTLDVLRKGIRDRGCKFQLAYFPPASDLNEETPAVAQDESVFRGPTIAIQYAKPQEYRSRAFPQRYPNFYGRTQEPVQRSGCPGCHQPVQNGPRPARDVAFSSSMSGAFRGRSGLGVRHNVPCWVENDLFAFQPGKVRRRGQPARPVDSERLCYRLFMGDDLDAR